MERNENDLKFTVVHKTYSSNKVTDAVSDYINWTNAVLTIHSKEKLEDIILENMVFENFFIAWENWIIEIKSIEDVKKSFPGINEKLLTIILDNTVLDLDKTLFGLKIYKTIWYEKNIKVWFSDKMQIRHNWIYKNWIKIFTFNVEIKESWNQELSKNLKNK